MLSRQRGIGRGRRLLLVALLLLLFGTIANGQEEHTVGAGQHTLKDGKVHLAPEWDAKDNYDCVVNESEDKITFSIKKVYIVGVCTVDLVTSDEKDEFEFVVVLKPEEEGKTLEECLTSEFIENTFQFNYGKTNAFVKASIYNAKDECPDKAQCKKAMDTRGKCMDSTSLEISWSKNTTRLSLNGEPSVSLMRIRNSTEIFDGKEGAALHVKVMKNETGNGGAYEVYKPETPSDILKSADLKPICIDPDKAVPPPVLWPIADALDKEGKKPMRLLVFHLLPPAEASHLKGSYMAPKCRPSIEFSKAKYSLLNEKALTVPTSTTETLEHPTTESVRKGRQAEGVAITTIVVIVSGSLLLVAITAFLVWYCVCQGVDTEDVQREAAAHGTAAAAAAGEVEKEQQPQQAEEVEEAHT